MDRVNEYAAAKLVVGFASIIVGLPAFAFALFGWYQAAIGISRYVCVAGSLGAIFFGASLALDGIKARSH